MRVDSSGPHRRGDLEASAGGKGQLLPHDDAIGLEPGVRREEFIEGAAELQGHAPEHVARLDAVAPGREGHAVGGAPRQEQLLADLKEVGIEPWVALEDLLQRDRPATLPLQEGVEGVALTRTTSRTTGSWIPGRADRDGDEDTSEATGSRSS